MSAGNGLVIPFCCRFTSSLVSGALAAADGARKVEADALLKVPKFGRELCRKAILKYVPAGTPRGYLNKLKPVREELRRELDRLLREET